MSPEAQQPSFDDLAANLPDHHKAEFFQTLHQAGISSTDVELARLLRALQLYKAYYESIPSAVQEAAARIEKLKQEIERLSTDTRGSLDAGAQLAGQVIQEVEKARQDFAQIHKPIEDAMRQSIENLASRMAEQLNAGIEKSVILPLQSRLAELAESDDAFDAAIARNNKAAAALQKSTAEARRFHIWTYIVAGCLIFCSLALVAWFFLHRWYSDLIEQERVALVEQVGKNQAVLLQLSRSRRTLELIRDPENPRRKFLVMKNASGWQSSSKQGVIEFTE